MDAPFLGFNDLLRGGMDHDGREIDHTPKAVALWVGGSIALLCLFHYKGGFRVVIGAGTGG